MKDNDSLAGNLLLLLGLLTHRAPSVLSLVDAASLKEYIFLQSDTIKELCLSQSLGGFLQEGASYLS